MRLCRMRLFYRSVEVSDNALIVKLRSFRNLSRMNHLPAQIICQIRSLRKIHITLKMPGTSECAGMVS
jgi:hypothetical protein